MLAFALRNAFDVVREYQVVEHMLDLVEMRYFEARQRSSR